MTDTGRRPRTRANREGRPYQRGDGMWCAVAYDVTGKRRVLYAKTRAAVVGKRKDLERKIEDGRPVTTGRGVTLGQYLERNWLAVTLPQRVRSGRLGRSTFGSYRDMVRLHILPELGDEPLDGLSPARLRGWLIGLQDKPSARRRQKLRQGEEKLPEPGPLSPRTCQYAHAILRRALGDAVRDELIPRNPALLVEPPVVKGRKGTFLTAEEARRLMETAAEHRLWALWLTILGLGLRRGEALALRWGDVDLDVGTARIAGTKTDTSAATLALPASLVEVLREHRRRQSLERMQAKVWTDPGLVFTTSVGTPILGRNVGRAWEELCDRAGVRRVRVHDLRHTTASWLYAQGVELKTIQHQLRHSRLATTSEVYAHIMEEVQRKAADSMDGVLVDLTAKKNSKKATKKNSKKATR